MLRARGDGTAQGKYGVVWLVVIYPEQSHHPLRTAFSAISNKAYGSWNQLLAVIYESSDQTWH